MRGVAFAALLVVAPGFAAAQTLFERQVLAEANAVRADPSAYADALRSYREGFVGRIARDPATGKTQATREGVAAVDQAIAALRGRAPAPPLVGSPLLARSAADLAQAQAASGQVGHFSPDGESLADRVRRYGDVRGTVAEGIAYGQPDAAAVVRALVVDDGVADRSHRRDLLDPRLRYAGVACAPHPAYRTVCVLDYAGP